MIVTPLECAALSAETAPDVIRHLDVTYASITGVQPSLLSLDVFTAQNLTSAPVLLFVHGGAWVGREKSGGLLDVREQMALFFMGRGFSRSRP